MEFDVFSNANTKCRLLLSFAKLFVLSSTLSITVVGYWQFQMVLLYSWEDTHNYPSASVYYLCHHYSPRLYLNVMYAAKPASFSDRLHL
ncbi:MULTISPECIES: hypothetical protein [unclassified Nostoc]|uniref:hypothetical protein n=1 Tax=unclassified Nostoc TaxID=2593658 RepID=UPI002AD3CCB8|nr:MULTISPECIES: hypothetical protein [unclassified Nostoc]MDZ8096511.1 hypothetical protein [Nostoc sp. DedQUE05]MDZ8130053.1 hypothetical protein [Nostoc sp. DedQUE07]